MECVLYGKEVRVCGVCAVWGGGEGVWSVLYGEEVRVCGVCCMGRR